MSSLRHLVKRGEETDDLQTAIKNTVLTGMSLLNSARPWVLDSAIWCKVQLVWKSHIQKILQKIKEAFDKNEDWKQIGIRKVQIGLRKQR